MGIPLPRQINQGLKVQANAFSPDFPTLSRAGRFRPASLLRSEALVRTVFTPKRFSFAESSSVSPQIQKGRKGRPSTRSFSRGFASRFDAVDAEKDPSVGAE